MIRLHHVPFSRSFRVLWLLEELGLDFDVVPYAIRDGSLRGAFQGLSPAGRVPALEIDGLTVFESGAIVELLSERYPEAGLGRDVGDPQRPRFLEFLHFAETMASVVEQLNLNHIFLRDPAQASPVVIKVNTARLAGTLAALERLLEQGPWLLGDRFSSVDTMMGFNLFAAPYYVSLDAYPRLQAYVARLETREGYQRARLRDGVQDFYTKDFYPVPEIG
ncbi:glutathione S-transferase family protein [Puniceibacterium sp. IMCC21224]|uniref:glutathione S-transferase family protein n=1 Tax=Puniceibacterium sp. IMCC21224 TaxID=1618204 RepID=UPI00064DBB63|nr:glutathione S-transferase family protein [Puniceibacterium sp. IMCC21224]KMK67057.1 glutathione S-transferase [Puniceibacterium sp. IMCC21224]